MIATDNCSKCIQKLTFMTITSTLIESIKKKIKPLYNQKKLTLCVLLLQALALIVMLMLAATPTGTLTPKTSIFSTVSIRLFLLGISSTLVNANQDISETDM